MMEKYFVRQAKLSDLPIIMDIESQSFNLVTQESIDVYRERITHFADGFYIFLYQKKVIGFLTSEIWSSLPTKDNNHLAINHSIADVFNRQGTVLYISSFELNPKFRGRGLGTYFFDYFLSDIKNKFHQLEKAVLIVNENWVQAINIYHKQNFKLAFDLKNFFIEENKCPSTGLVLVKTFN